MLGLLRGRRGGGEPVGDGEADPPPSGQLEIQHNNPIVTGVGDGDGDGAVPTTPNPMQRHGAVADAAEEEPHSGSEWDESGLNSQRRNRQIQTQMQLSAGSAGSARDRVLGHRKKTARPSRRHSTGSVENDEESGSGKSASATATGEGEGEGASGRVEAKNGVEFETESDGPVHDSRGVGFRRKTLDLRESHEPSIQVPQESVVASEAVVQLRNELKALYGI